MIKVIFVCELQDTETLIKLLKELKKIPKKVPVYSTSIESQGELKVYGKKVKGYVIKDIKGNELNKI